MDSTAFRYHGKRMVDYLADYVDNIMKYPVIPSVKPGYLAALLPEEAPMDSEPFEDIMKDFDEKIIPGFLHWEHPRFFAYFPNGSSFETILADMLSDMSGMVGFSWASGPVVTELEIVMLNWYGKAIGLPKHFISTTPGSRGGGVIETSASDAILLAMLAARYSILSHLRKYDEGKQMSEFLHKIIAYTSRESHSSVEKGANIALVQIRILESDETGSLRGTTLEQAMAEDEAKGLVPFFVSGIIGSTSTCAFDNLMELGAVCKKRPHVWFHVDCAYAGSGFICPELRCWIRGMDYADSINTNPNKWMLTCYDCSCLWVKDKFKFTDGLVIDPVYLRHEYSGIIDYRHWQIALSRRFRSLKLFFLFRSYGIKKLQAVVRNHISLAKYFESLVRGDDRFEVTNQVHLGLVCFRLKGEEDLTHELLTTINDVGKIHCIPGVDQGRFVIRFAVTYQYAVKEHIDFGWKVILRCTEITLEKIKQDLPSSRRHSSIKRWEQDLYRRMSK